MTKEAMLSVIFDQISEKREVFNSLEEMTFIEEYNVMEVHCIDLIEKMQDPNVTKLAKAFHLTKGAISKLIKKLMQEGAVESYQKAENKKEIYYRITESGRLIYKKHEALHQQRINRYIPFFNSLKEDEKAMLMDIFNRFDAFLAAELLERGVGEETYINSTECKSS